MEHKLTEEEKLTVKRYYVVLKILEADPVVLEQVGKLYIGAAIHAQANARVWYIR
jgi:hypothetical protein